ncbi:MAG: PEP/pyruvate-binding domain-containing protein [Gammaproteobacteria bacterium]
MLRTSLNTFIRILGLLLLLSSPFAVAGLPDEATLRGWIEDMKASDRGPFARIRWFCNDGKILPPKAYACVPHGGGSQHGEWTKRTKELRANGYYVANILADLDIDEFVKQRNYWDEFNQILIEQFLITADNGWVLRKARYYRGALQEENERKGAARLLTRLAHDPTSTQQRYVQLRTGARLLSHGAETQSVTKVRQLSASLSERDSGFLKLRSKIHVRPEHSDAKAVRGYATKTKYPDLVSEYRQLADTIDAVYSSQTAPKLLLKLAAKKNADKRLSSLARTGAAQLKSASTPEDRFLATANLMAGLRDQLPNAKTSAQRIAILDTSLALESEHFAAATQLREQLGKATRRQQVRWLVASANAIYGSGLITQRQRSALNAMSEDLQQNRISLRTYKETLDYYGLVPAWGTRQLHFYFQDSMHKLAAIEPMADLFIQDQLRGSPLFFYAQALDNVLRDANHLAGVRNELFGKDVGAGLRALNPGIAHGRILIAKGEKVSDFAADGIYLLPETISELPPVAGILTQGEGNPLSHVQLLARNLGIPNVAVGERLIPKLKAKQGKTVIMAVSPAGSVRLSEDKGEWERLFGKEKTKQDVLIRPDLNKLDLANHNLVRLSQLRAKDSGRVVGPKAAKLGELQHQYPEAVADGLAIPFGVFRQMLDQPYDAKRSVFEWMVDSYRSFESMPEDSRQRVDATEAFRKKLYDWILHADPGKAFRDRLRKEMTKTFGKDGSYGVFVRSDTNVEDLGGFTGAGLNLTVVNVVGFDNTVEAISRVWASPFMARSFAWRQALMSQPEHVYPAVLLLRSVPAEKSGVLVTQDIDTGNSGWLSVAVNEGVGGAVDGQAAESLRINTATGDVKLLAQATAPVRRRINPQGGIDKVPVSGSDHVLTKSDVKALIQLAKELPKRFPTIVDAKGNPAPADIEFGFLNGELKLFQIRPFLESQRATGGEYLKSLDSGLKDLDKIKVNMNELPVEND